MKSIGEKFYLILLNAIIFSSSALHATNLMTLCAKLDERVPPVIRIINYWAKHSKLIGPATKFKSYALFLFVIYFLQTRNPPVLPTIKTMFEKSGKYPF